MPKWLRRSSDALLQELRHFSGTALQADDLTVVVVKAV